MDFAQLPLSSTVTVFRQYMSVFHTNSSVFCCLMLEYIGISYVFHHLPSIKSRHQIQLCIIEVAERDKKEEFSVPPHATGLSSQVLEIMFILVDLKRKNACRGALRYEKNQTLQYLKGSYNLWSDWMDMKRVTIK
ncbi:hypothetical protein BDZ97DRAFT_1768528 [Flammula alnicola]|nr:hypothetical protein BDZ97DRAFT_1768528 [Flammula alnicola]